MSMVQPVDCSGIHAYPQIDCKTGKCPRTRHYQEFLALFYEIHCIFLINFFDRCVICFMQYKDKEKMTVLSCAHDYHSHCIAEWLKLSKVRYNVQ